MPDQKTMRTRCLGGFSVMWVTKLLISPVKKGFFAQKQPNLAQNWHFWSIWARPCGLLRCPVGGSVGGCGARAVSRKTPIYFISVDQRNAKNVLCVQLPHPVQKIEVKDSAIKFLKEQGILKTSVKFKCGCDLATIKQRTGTGYYYFRCAKCDSMTSIRLLLLIIWLWCNWNIEIWSYL